MLEQTIEQGFQRVWQMFQELARQQEESDKRLDKYIAQQRETDKKLGKYFGQVKELSSNWGKFVEAIVEPSAAKLFQDRGIPVIGSEERKKKQLGGETIEIDILLVNTDVVIAVEVKTTLSVDDVNDHIAKHLKPFKRFFPEYQDKKVYGAVAYIHVDEQADRYAYKKGLFVLAFTADEMVTIKNDSNFIPKTWGNESA